MSLSGIGGERRESATRPPRFGRRIKGGRLDAFLLIVAAAFVVGGCGGVGASPRPNGQIVFGTSVDTAAFAVASPMTSFAAGTLVGWVAYFSESVNDTKLTITIARVNAGGGEESLFTGDQDVANPQIDTWAHDPTDALTSQGPGQYTLRYIRASDQKVLAAGTITVTP